MVSLSLGPNVSAQAVARGIGRARERVDASMLRMATGQRILRAADDVAGVAAAERLRAEVDGLTTAARSARDAASLAQSADAMLAEIGTALLRIRGFALRASNDALSSSERTALQTEVAAQQAEITRLASSATFAGNRLLDGSFVGKRFLVGARGSDQIQLSLGDATATGIGAVVATSDGNIANARALGVGVTDGSSGVAAQTLSLQGPDGTADVAVGADEDAGTIAARIEVVADVTGIAVQAATSLKLTATAPAGGGLGTGSFQLSTRTAGVQGPIAVITASIGVGGALSSVASRINGYSATTGVTASIGDAANELVLRAAGGADIVIADVATSDSTGPTTLLSAQGLRDDGTGTLVTQGAAVALAADTGVVAGGALLLSAAGMMSITTSAKSSLFLTTRTTGSSLSVASLSVATTAGAAAAVAVVDDALETVLSERAVLGGFQNRLGATIAVLESTGANVDAARARITDVDVAAEAASIARSRVLAEAGVSVLAQANQSADLALRLLTAPTKKAA